MTKQKEQWLLAPHCEGLYEISNMGRFCSIKNGRRLIHKPGDNGDGYPRVTVSINGKRKAYLVHRLVWEAFIGNIPLGMEIDHLNNNRGDARLCNLDLVTHSENVRRGHSCNLKENKLSKYIGVTYDKRTEKYVSYVKFNGVRCRVGSYTTEDEAYASILEVEAGRLIPPMFRPGFRSSKYKGVSFYKSTRKWAASIRVEKKNYRLGYFSTEDEAYAEVLKFKEFVKNGTFFSEREKHLQKKKLI